MVSLLMVRSKPEVRMMYYRDKEEDMREEKDCNTSPKTTMGIDCHGFRGTISIE